MKNCVFLLSALACSISMAVQAKSFWNADLYENLTNVKKIATADGGVEGFTENVDGEPWPGIGPNGEAAGTVYLPYSRIPAISITEDNKIVVAFDLRWVTASDQNRIDPGMAISEDGGYTWNKLTAWNFNETSSVYNSLDSLRRAMDPTLLYNPVDNSMYVLHGTWTQGSRNWYAGRLNYYNNDIWAATIYKSTDGGYTWEKSTEFSRTVNADVFAKVQKGEGYPTLGFLGGVGTGIIMRDGTLVFPIQTAHENGIATTILYSKDNGVTWDMPETTTPVAPNQSSLENMVFEIYNDQIGDPNIPYKLVMTGREGRAGSEVPWARWAYYSEDMGVTWHEYTPVHGFNGNVTTAQPTQGSSIYVTLPSGRRVLLVSKPNGDNDSWSRGNLALWMADAKDPTHIEQVTIVRPGSGNAKGAGYSSLAYKEGNLFIAYEDDGDITVKNLTEYLEFIEAKALEWDLPNEIPSEVAYINALAHLNQGQKDTLSAKMESANDYAIALSNVLNNEMLELKDEASSLSSQSSALTTALPSLISQFNSDVATVNELTSSSNGTYLDYAAIQDLIAALNASFAALSTPLDFSKYVAQADKLRAYDTDIAHSSYNNFFVEYDSLIRNSTNSPTIALGVNGNISDNVRAGVFFEHEDLDDSESSAVGVRAKYSLGDNTFSAFARYRTVKHDAFIERNKNVDIYVSYAKKFSVSDNLSISPSVGVYASRSSSTLLDVDVVADKRWATGADVGVNFEYKVADMRFSVRPNIAVVKDDITLMQSNYHANQYKVSDSNTVYGLSVGLEKQFANSISLGAKAKVQKYGSQSADVSLGVNLGFNF